MNSRPQPAQPRRSDYPLWTTEKVRFTDMDANQHVHNSIYPIYLEFGRSHMRKSIGIPTHFSGRIVRFEINFMNEIRYPGNIEIGTAVKSIGRSSMIIAQAIEHHGVFCCTADTVLVFVNKDTKSKIVVEGDFKRSLTSILVGHVGSPES
jgi:acyl-CoA thioester hydrolase